MATVADSFRLPFPASTFGNRFGIKGPFYGPQGHRGTDFVRAGGTNIPVIANGKVVRVLWSYVLGNVTIVKHYVSGGGAGNDVYSGYCHQSHIGVKVGQVVKKGQIIGRVGTTGSASSGNHLHLTMSHEVMGAIYGDVFDPIAYIEKHATTAAAKPTKVKTTKAKRGEGLGAIATRVKVPLVTLEKLNPSIKAPDYIVQLGQTVRYA